MTDWVTLLLNIEPKTKGRPRFTKQGHAYTDKKTRKYEADLKQLMRLAWRPRDVLLGPIAIEIIAFFARPKSSKRLFPTVKPDIDNLTKSILDAANGILWQDDKQVIYLKFQKWYSTENPLQSKIVIHLKEITCNNTDDVIKDSDL